MKKTLIAVAVAAALPAAAFAQANVTLSGFVKLGVANTKYSNASSTWLGLPGATPNDSGTSLDDGSSRFIISGTDDLGNGMRGIFMIDTRFRPDESDGKLASGNSYVGVTGGFGTVRIGRLDQYYVHGTDSFGGLATPLQHSNISILSWVGGVNNTAGLPSSLATALANSNAGIANASRTANLVRYDIPKIGGLSGGIGYSFNFQGNDGGVGDAAKGDAWTLDLTWANGPIAVGGAYWDADFEGETATAGSSDDGQKAGRLFGSYDFGMFKAGLTFDRSEVKVLGGTFKRNAWSLPLSGKVGPGTLLFTYTMAGDVDASGAGFSDINDSGAKMFSIGYDYPFSKRTSLGISYAQLKNDRNATYQLFTAAALGGHPNPMPGQDVRQFYVGLKHAF